MVLHSHRHPTGRDKSLRFDLLIFLENQFVEIDFLRPCSGLFLVFGCWFLLFLLLSSLSLSFFFIVVAFVVVARLPLCRFLLFVASS